MSWKFWKPLSERAYEEFHNGYQKGLECSNFLQAIKFFDSARVLYDEAGDLIGSNLSWAMLKLSEALVNQNSRQAWIDASEAFVKVGRVGIFALNEIPADLLAVQCSLKAHELMLSGGSSDLEKLSLLEKLVDG
ncbi:MAG: hypothetical protein ACQXXJ_03980, partial [Candidatus Bathyarchaeia archaeon]